MTEASALPAFGLDVSTGRQLGRTIEPGSNSRPQ
jgi:hypothetical protein